MVLSILFTFLLFARFSTPTRAADVPLVQLGNTTVTGSAFLNLEFYGGIPYAEPPVGNLMFKPPVPLRGLSSPTFDGSHFGADCLQPGESASSEDCLTINVFKPAGLTKDVKLPVLAFIHGGGYIAASSAKFNATAIVAQSISRGTPIIYVSFNYRLGPLGFPPGREAAASNALNLGLKDQLVALQWIQDNIAVFNGDNSKVTVFGESAGAMSIAAHQLNPNFKNLARAVILESGGAASGHLFPPSRGQVDWDNFVSAVPECAKCKENAFSCLRRANSSDLRNAIATLWPQSKEGYPFVPVLDGPHGLLPELPSGLIAKGRFARLPFITGANLDEGTFLTPPTVNSTADVEAVLMSNYTTPTVPSRQLKAAISELMKLYPDNPALGSPFNTGNETFSLSPQWKRLSAIVGDIWFHSQRRALMQAATKFGVKTYGYLLTDPGAPSIGEPTIGPTANPAALGVTHTADLLYIFGLNAAFGRPESAQKLGVQMIDYWVSFTNSLDPNDGRGSARPMWSQYSSKNQKIIELTSVNMTMIPDNYRERQIDFINSHAAVFSH
ncbi:carboxylic ester hydrolase [Favolaschia claudopus]|uniref:Carboxylic ester hydrolase n=1 Tax=Favolaschia claudopus TaxID=2862362 RepID=A0AAW0ABH2_9AGAR